MRRDRHEIEDKYTVEGDAALPDLTGLPGVSRVQDGGVLDLEAVYFDTAGLSLAAAGISLRRRTGGADDGWHLKLPTKSGRYEVHESLARARRTVPKSLRDLLVARTRDELLHPVAVVRTRRHVLLLLDEDGSTLAELSDDRVSAGGVETSEPVVWREWELELVHGDRALLAAAAPLIEDAGGLPTTANKLALALGDRMPDPTAPVTAEPTPEGPASLVLQARLHDLVASVRRCDPLVRRDVPDAVHTMRVAVRRLRSALATYRPLFVRAETEPVRAELKWLAAALGEPRDAEVMRARLETMLAGESAVVVRGAGHRRMDRELRMQYALARERLLAVLGSDRYLVLLDRLDELAARPPLSERAAEPVDAVLRARVRRDYQRLVDRVALAEEADDPGERAERLHEARKAVKRVRYAADPLIGVYGKPAKRFVDAMKRVQSHLGDHHDASVTQQRLRELGDQATSAGDNAFVFGVLHAREERALTEADRAFVREWRKASRKKRRRWLQS
jgi:CHAD domain-containing protein